MLDSGSRRPWSSVLGEPWYRRRLRTVIESASTVGARTWRAGFRPTSREDVGTQCFGRRCIRTVGGGEYGLHLLCAVGIEASGCPLPSLCWCANKMLRSNGGGWWRQAGEFDLGGHESQTRGGITGEESIHRSEAGVDGEGDGGREDGDRARDLSTSDFFCDRGFWVFLTYEAYTGFFTYHGFVTITSSSRIISRDKLSLPIYAVNVFAPWKGLVSCGKNISIDNVKMLNNIFFVCSRNPWTLVFDRISFYFVLPPL
jgi:hypothetical protein